MSFTLIFFGLHAALAILAIILAVMSIAFSNWAILAHRAAVEASAIGLFGIHKQNDARLHCRVAVVFMCASFAALVLTIIALAVVP